VRLSQVICLLQRTCTPAMAGIDEPDKVAEMLKPDRRSTCASPLPLLHWLYLHFIVDQPYERQPQQQQPPRQAVPRHGDAPPAAAQPSGRW